MAASDRFVFPLQQAFDNAGLVEPGAKLYFWVGGAGAYSVAKDTYSESTLSSANANPVVADASGRFGAIFLGSGSYGVQLKDADGVLLYAQDPVAAATTSAASTTVVGTVELATVAEGTAGSSTTLVPPVAVVTEMIQQGFMYGTTGGSANAITITPTRTPSAHAAGMIVFFKASSSNTAATTINYAGLGATTVKVLGATGILACIGGEIVSGVTYIATYSAVDAVWIVSPQGYTPALSKWPLGWLSGLTLSRATATTYGIETGVAANEDSGVRYDMTLSSAFTKSLSAWTVGTAGGSLDTGAVAATTCYHAHLIREDSSGLIDVLLSLSATAPTMPSGYTARRRMGSIRTNGSSQIVAFSQVGDEFLLDVAVVDVDAQNPGTPAVTRTLSVPTGVKVMARITVGAYVGTTNNSVNISSLDVSDQVAQAPATASLTLIASVASTSTGPTWMFASQDVRTNTSGQVRSRINVSGAADRVGIITRGWIDTRGRN